MLVFIAYKNEANGYAHINKIVCVCTREHHQIPSEKGLMEGNIIIKNHISAILTPISKGKRLFSIAVFRVLGMDCQLWNIWDLLFASDNSSNIINPVFIFGHRLWSMRKLHLQDCMVYLMCDN